MSYLNGKHVHFTWVILVCHMAIKFMFFLLFADQRLDLSKQNPEDNDNIRGQIVISITSRDRVGGSSSGAVVDSRNIPPTLPPTDPNELPEG